MRGPRLSTRVSAQSVSSGVARLSAAPGPGDRNEFTGLMRASRSFHSPWATAPTDDERFAAYLADARRADFEALLLCRSDDGAIMGFFNFSQIVRRGFQSAYLGYAVGQPFAGQGYMRDGLELVLRYAFTVSGSTGSRPTSSPPTPDLWPWRRARAFAARDFRLAI